MQEKRALSCFRWEAQNLVVATEEQSLAFAGMLRRNETDAFLFARLQEPTTTEALVEASLAEYDTTRKCAQAEVVRFEPTDIIATSAPLPLMNRSTMPAPKRPGAFSALRG